MIFQETKLRGAYVIIPERREDVRGFFARTWCVREFAEHGLETRLVQCSVSFNKLRGTLRGMHYQKPPNEETKLVRCTSGSIYDVIIDIRPDSPTYGQHFGVVLSATERNMLYVPKGFAHGFQALENETEVHYQMSEFFEAEAAAGFRWNDPAFGIVWPVENPTIIERDKLYPDFSGRTTGRLAISS